MTLYLMLLNDWLGVYILLLMCTEVWKLDMAVVVIMWYCYVCIFLYWSAAVIVSCMHIYGVQQTNKISL